MSDFLRDAFVMAGLIGLRFSSVAQASAQQVHFETAVASDECKHRGGELFAT